LGIQFHSAVVGLGSDLDGGLPNRFWLGQYAQYGMVLPGKRMYSSIFGKAAGANSKGCSWHSGKPVHHLHIGFLFQLPPKKRRHPKSGFFQFHQAIKLAASQWLSPIAIKKHALLV
jgi:hypothetical protein